MDRLKSRISSIIPVFMLAGTVVFTGCADGNDIYNPDRVQEEAKKVFPIKDIDPDQTWETCTLCEAFISVNGISDEVYTFKVYTGNPYNGPGTASLLATATGGQAAHFTFDIPSALHTVYVMKVDSRGYSSAIPAAVKDGKVKTIFGGSTSKNVIQFRTVITRTSNDSKLELPTEAPNDCIKWETLSDSYHPEKGKNYTVSSTSNTKQVWTGTPVNLYIDGEVTLSGANSLDIIGEATMPANVYILPGSKLIFKDIRNGIYVPNNYMNIYICKGGTLSYEDEKFSLGTDTYLYNEGNFVAKNLEIANNAKFTNYGNLELDGNFICSNTTLVENNGAVTVGSFELTGTSKFHNTGYVTVEGNSVLGGTGCAWDNEGTFHTTNLTFKATSANWTNRCQLLVDEILDIQPSQADITLDAGTYTECKKLELSKTTVSMGENAYFHVKEEAKFHAKANNMIKGPDIGHALLQMAKAMNDSGAAENNVIYGGNLFVACNDHFSTETGNDIFKLEDSAELSNKDGANISIPNTACSPGYSSVPDGGGDNDRPLCYAYGFEDMEVGDYDFNDVVLYVSVPYQKEGKYFIDVTLKAAGASKKLSVLLNDKIIFSDVHEALGVPAGTLVNTGKADGTEKTKTVEVGKNFNLKENGNFSITDGKGRNIHVPAFTAGFQSGDVPYAIRVAREWAWPKESVSIEKAYPAFEQWAKDATTETDWYKTPANEKTMK